MIANVRVLYLLQLCFEEAFARDHIAHSDKCLRLARSLCCAHHFVRAHLERGDETASLLSLRAFGAPEFTFCSSFATRNCPHPLRSTRIDSALLSYRRSARIGAARRRVKTRRDPSFACAHRVPLPLPLPLPRR